MQAIFLQQLSLRSSWLVQPGSSIIFPEIISFTQPLIYFESSNLYFSQAKDKFGSSFSFELLLYLKVVICWLKKKLILRFLIGFIGFSVFYIMSVARLCFSSNKQKVCMCVLNRFVWVWCQLFFLNFHATFVLYHKRYEVLFDFCV